jgi:hypothetical protein
MHTSLPSPLRDRQGGYDLWQGRFWEHMIRDDDDFFPVMAVLVTAIHEAHQAGCS